MCLDVLGDFIQRLATPKSSVVDFPMTRGANADEVGGVKGECLLLHFIASFGETAEVVAMLGKCDFVLQLAHLTQRIFAEVCVSQSFPQGILINALAFLSVEVVALSGGVVFPLRVFLNRRHFPRHTILAIDWEPPR